MRTGSNERAATSRPQRAKAARYRVTRYAIDTALDGTAPQKILPLDMHAIHYFTTQYRQCYFFLLQEKDPHPSTTKGETYSSSQEDLHNQSSSIITVCTGFHAER